MLTQHFSTPLSTVLMFSVIKLFQTVLWKIAKLLNKNDKCVGVEEMELGQTALRYLSEGWYQSV